MTALTRQLCLQQKVIEPSARFRLKQKFIAALQMVRVWRARQQQRKLLAEMPAYLLKDIGLTEADRYQETRKSFWQP